MSSTTSNWVTIFPLVSLYGLSIMGYSCVCTPWSDEPSVMMVNGCFFNRSTSSPWWCFAMRWTNCIVFVLLHEKAFAIWRSRNICGKSLLRSSLMTSGRLCSTIKFAIMHFALITLLMALPDLAKLWMLWFSLLILLADVCFANPTCFWHHASRLVSPRDLSDKSCCERGTHLSSMSWWKAMLLHK